jgi:hypothetical protein
MPKTTNNSTEIKERAAVGRERKLALMLRALLDANKDTGDREIVGADEAQAKVEMDANALLDELGYGDLEATQSVVRRLTAELNAATEAANWGRVSQLGKELERARNGRPITKVATKAVASS